MILSIETGKEIPTPQKIKAKGIRIKWSENPSPLLQAAVIEGGDGRLLSWDEAQDLIKYAALANAPNSGGYDKTAFIIEFEDGETYEGRLDMKRCHGCMTESIIGSHVLRFVEYHARLTGAPDWMIEQYGPERAETCYLNSTKDHESFLEFYNRYEIPGNRKQMEHVEEEERKAYKKKEAEEALKAQEKARKAREIERAEAERTWAELLALKPEGVEALIVAELMERQCDPGTDYWASRVTRVVALDWKKKPRTCFKVMRRAAGRFEETAHLQDGPAEYEHRENYSMGGGNYLKDSYRHSDGWKVKILDLNYSLGMQKPVEILPHFYPSDRQS